MFLIFDTETVGLPKNFAAPLHDLDNWPRVVQLAWQLHDSTGNLLSCGNHIIKPDGFTIPFNSQKIHGISTEKAQKEGLPLPEVLNKITLDLEKTRFLVGHNVNFDCHVLGAEFLRLSKSNLLESLQKIDTCSESVDFCKLPGGVGGKFKFPKLDELYQILFTKELTHAHDAAIDVDATAKAFFELLKRRIVNLKETLDIEKIQYRGPKIRKVNFEKNKEKENLDFVKNANQKSKIKYPFCNLHTHSHYSILQSSIKVQDLVNQAVNYKMPAVALTDLGNMYGAFEFNTLAIKNNLKPIMGCEFYVAEERLTLKFSRDNPDRRFRQVLLAKNKKGYENLIKLCSLGFTEGLYGLYPRIDKKLIAQYSEGLIALSGSLEGDIPKIILNIDENKAEKELLWWKEVFKDDFYIELNRHDIENENHLNKVLLKFSEKYDIKNIAAHECYYTQKEDWVNQDTLLCIKENQYINTPIGKGRDSRLGLPNQNYYFKSSEEMEDLFADLPDAINNIEEIVEKIEIFSLNRDIILPKFDIPQEFKNTVAKEGGEKDDEDEYLKHLTLKGAKDKYKNITDELEKRITFELDTLKKLGFSGYFLIIYDILNEAKKRDIYIGPGRGSCVGSVVAYCLDIIKVNPLEYNLIFERFLNPERVSMPDIDIDFENEKRDELFEYVNDKYGYEYIAKIITFQTLGAKAAIKDASRVMELPLADSIKLSNMIPKIYKGSLKDLNEKDLNLKKIIKENTLESKVLKRAEKIEGHIKSVGSHPCGIIISPQKLTQHIPITKVKDTDFLVSQFDNKFIESAGMLKMDFLVLNTLSILKTTVQFIKDRHKKTLVLENIPLDDAKTYELLSRGEANGIFQFEKEDIARFLKQLKPDRIEDLIALCALNRPGPIDYIPNYIKRKHGQEKITYDFPEMEEILSETYGITIYQEQVILLSQKLASFSKGEADLLRKAIAKKNNKEIDKIKPKFLKQAIQNGYDEKILQKIWNDWEKFADYAFNKSHSVAYSIISYQTAYFKAHYTEEFMVAILSHNLKNADKISFFLDECKSLQIKILGPNVNKAFAHFSFNEKNEVYFGFEALKGTGKSAAQAIVDEREKNGPYRDIFDFATRIDLKTVTKKTFECLAKSGAFDCFPEYHRNQYIQPDSKGETLIDKALHYGLKSKKEQNTLQRSLFEKDKNLKNAKPKLENVAPLSKFEILNLEKSVLGLYISGHPLDIFQFEIEKICTPNNLKQLENPSENVNYCVGGIVTEVNDLLTKKQLPFGKFVLEDFNTKYTFLVFGKKYIDIKKYLFKDNCIYISGKFNFKSGKEPLFDISHLGMLQDLKKEKLKSINLTINLENIDDYLLDNLETLFTKHKGNNNLRFSVVTYHENRSLNVECISRRYWVDPTIKFLKNLEQNEGVSTQIVLNQGN